LFNLKTIKMEEEANESFIYLVNETMKVTKCDKAQAQKRVSALFQSGILNGGSPDNPLMQKKIDEFMFTQID